jgi:GT2 family glycosyltransferase/glycosyltransferase involved in cell wall biosynthesis
VHRFFKLVILPLLDALRPQRIVEVGVEAGATTLPLLEWAASHGATVDAIDPVPSLDASGLAPELQAALTLHVCPSTEALPEIADVDLVLIDGDHNWFTVINELRLLEAVAGKREPPLVLLHDIGWPYGRRDMYYSPEAIPAKHRQPYEYRGMRPGSEELSDEGLNPHLANATSEGTPANGVLTAVEQFMAESDAAWRLIQVPGLNGLGVLLTESRYADSKEVKRFVDSLRTAKFLTAQCAAIEAQRVEWQSRANNARARLADAELTASKQPVLQKQLADSHTRIKLLDQELASINQSLADAKAATTERETALAATRTELEVALAATRTERETDLAATRAELEGARSSNDRLQAQLSGLQAESDRTQASLDAAVDRAQVIERERDVGARRVDLLEAEIDELHDELKQRLAELRKARRRARELGEEADEARTSASREQAARERAAEQLSEAVMRAEQLESEQTAARAEREQALAAVAAAERELAALRLRLDEALGREQRVEHELSVAEAQRARILAALARARVDADVAQAEYESLTRRLAEATAMPAAADAPELTGSAEELALLLEQLGTVRTQRDQLVAQLVSQSPQLTATTAPPLPALAAPEESREWPALPAEERAVQTKFALAYWGRPEPPAGGAEAERERAQPAPLDTRGVLVPVGEDQQEPSSVDVVVCVHDALDDARMCLWSLLAKTARRFSLIVVNDGSDEPTTEMLEQIQKDNPAVRLIHKAEPPHGYTIAANIGLRASRADYVILLNSDTIVTPGWLHGIVAYGDDHPDVGVLGPLSNAASHQSVPELRSGGAWATNPLPPWLTPDGVAKLLERVAPHTATRLPFINGFCYAIKRSTLDAVGLLDEDNFGAGYCEENDFSHRARLAGFELAVVGAAYVYHAKSRSYGVEGRDARARRNYETFLEKHGRETIQELVTAMEGDRSLEPVRLAIGDAIASPETVGSALADGGTLSIFFVLPSFSEGGSGGTHSIYQEVSGLRQLGLSARIAVPAKRMDRARRAYDDADELFVPFADSDELFEQTLQANVISATHYKSVAILREVYERRQDFLPAYYVQDYEPFFDSATGPDEVEAYESYTAIPGMLLFAKTHWVCNVISSRHNVFAAKVTPSIDERVYRDRRSQVTAEGPLRVSAMVRPRTPRRQPSSTVSVLERLIAEHAGAVEVTTFGCPPADLEKLTERREILGRHLGVLRREQVSELLGSSDVFLDVSTYQAFGRTALEAMACGCTAIVPWSGGVWEFLVDGVNGIAVDTFDRENVYSALSGLVGDRERLAALRAGAAATASRYSVLAASISEYVLFEEEHRRRFRSDPAERSAAAIE